MCMYTPVHTRHGLEDEKTVFVPVLAAMTFV